METQATARMRLLPWWFVFIAWFLVIATSITAAFFTVLYGLQFGKRRQEQWLTALAISVFQDILVSQPIKIFALSLFVAFVIKKPNNVDINEENDKLIQDERWIQESLHNVRICHYVHLVASLNLDFKKICWKKRCMTLKWENLKAPKIIYVKF